MPSIVKIGHAALRTPTRKVPVSWLKRPAAKILLKRMFKEMRRARGVGLAANQLGLSHRLFVMENQNGPRYPGRTAVPPQAWFNPRILSRKGPRVLDWEGCLSIPGYRGLTPRFSRVVFEAIGPDGRKVKKTVTGFEARIVQHEVDHLDGFFYVDRLKNMGMWMHEDELNKRR